MATAQGTGTYINVSLQNNPMGEAWVNFINSLKILLVPLPDERGMDQYLPFRDEVLKHVLSPTFVEQLEFYWASHLNDNNDAFSLLLMELKAFPLAVEVEAAQAANAATEVTEEKKKKSWIKRWLGRGSTVTGSVKDIMNDLPGFAKNGLTILKELLDLFK